MIRWETYQNSQNIYSLKQKYVQNLAFWNLWLNLLILQEDPSKRLSWIQSNDKLVNYWKYLFNEIEFGLRILYAVIANLI